MKLVMVVEARWSEESDPHDMARHVILGHMPGVKIRRAQWAETDADLDDVLDDEEE